MVGDENKNHTFEFCQIIKEQEIVQIKADL